MVICAAVKGQSNAGHPPLSAAWMEVYRVMQSVFKKAGISENNSILGFSWWLEGGLCAFQRLRLQVAAPGKVTLISGFSVFQHPHKTSVTCLQR